MVVSKVFRVGQEESTSRSVALLDEGPDVGGLLREERRQEGGPGEGPWTGFPFLARDPEAWPPALGLDQAAALEDEDDDHVCADETMAPLGRCSTTVA